MRKQNEMKTVINYKTSVIKDSVLSVTWCHSKKVTFLTNKFCSHLFIVPYSNAVDVLPFWVCHLQSHCILKTSSYNCVRYPLPADFKWLTVHFLFHKMAAVFVSVCVGLVWGEGGDITSWELHHNTIPKVGDNHPPPLLVLERTRRGGGVLWKKSSQ